MSLREHRQPCKLSNLSMRDILTQLQYLVYVIRGWTVRGLNPGSGKMFFYSPKRSNPLRSPYTLLNNTFWGSFLGAKRLEREVNNSSPSSLEVKNKRIYTSSHPIYLHCEGSDTSFLFNHKSALERSYSTTGTRIKSRIIVITILLYFSADNLHTTCVIKGRFTHSMPCPCRAHAVPMLFPCHAVPLRVYNVSFPFDLHSGAVSDSHLP